MRKQEQDRCRSPEAGFDQARSSCPGPPERTRLRHGQRSFTLLEVIIACGIFFLVGFSILELVARSLAAARALQVREPDAGMLAATLSMTNILEEGTESGDFEDFYPGIYPGFRWSQEILEVGSNGLFRVDFVVYRQTRRGAAESRMSVLMFRPDSPPGSASGGF